MSFTVSALVLSWVAIALLALAMAGMLRQLRQLSWRLDNPGMQLDDGRPRIVTELRTIDLANEGAPTFVLFVDSNCASCREVLPRFEELAVSTPAINFVTMYERDPIGPTLPSPVRVLVHMSEAFARLRIPLTPFVALAGGDHEISQAAPVGAPDLLEAFVAAGIEGGTDEAAA